MDEVYVSVRKKASRCRHTGGCHGNGVLLIEKIESSSCSLTRLSVAFMAWVVRCLIESLSYRYVCRYSWCLISRPIIQAIQLPPREGASAWPQYIYGVLMLEGWGWASMLWCALCSLLSPSSVPNVDVHLTPSCDEEWEGPFNICAQLPRFTTALWTGYLPS